MDNASAREFVNYSASMITLANHMKDRMTINEFLMVFTGNGRGNKRQVFEFMYDLGLITADDWYDNGAAKSVRWVR